MTLLKKLALVYLVLVCFFSCKEESKITVAETSNSDYAKFVSAITAKGIPTGNILVYENGEVIFKSSKGLRSINPLDSLNLESQFRLASVSKQFTGMAIMKLKEAGKIDYDQNVNTILVNFPYDNITIRQLLHHISGLTDYERLIDENFVREDSTKHYILGNDEILELFYRVDPELDFQPGERYEYSNTGYLVLASIVEKVSGQHFSAYLKEHITEPIGMNHTTLYKYQIATDSKMPNRVYGYGLALNQKDFVDNDYNIVNDVRGDGGVYSTLGDLFKWNMALANYSIIPKGYLDEAWTSGTLNNGEETGYGFGWRINSKPDTPLVVGHSGGWVGFATYLHNEVDEKNGFIILTNNSSDYVRDIFNGISNIMKNEPYEIPDKNIRTVLAEKIFEEDIDKAITYFHDLKKNAPEDYESTEAEINILGYQLMNANKNNAAVKIFKLNVEEFPKSANVYDSYADALLVKGDSLKALENFRRCFAMDSTLNYAKDKAEALENALKTN